MRKSMAYKKDRIMKVIMSCETRPQFNTAINYCKRMAADSIALTALTLRCCIVKERQFNDLRK